MIEIEVTCEKCKEELVVKDTYPLVGRDAIGIKVTPCDCTSKPDDCSECEDLKYLKNKLAVLEEKLNNVRAVFLNPEDDGAKTAQPTKFESHVAKNDKEKPGVNTLQPTKDIVSTGGAKIPGIKEGSAEGVKADY